MNPHRKKTTTAALLCIGLLLYTTPAEGQLDTLAKLNLAHVAAVSVDQLGNFYFVLANNRIQKRDLNGKLIHESHLATHRLSLIEAWSPLSIFIYSKKDHRYTTLSHRLDTLYSQSLNTVLSIPPKLVCPDSRPNKIWIFDSIDNTLKKVNLYTAEVEIKNPLPKKWINDSTQITFMRAYQNEVFMLDKKAGIYVFSNIGRPLTWIEVENLAFFNFIGEELCYIKEGVVLLANLYTGETRILQNISHINNIKFTIATDERLVIVTDSSVYFVTIDP